MSDVRTWETMKQRIHAQLLRQTDTSVDEWNARIKVESLEDEPALRTWLGAQGVTGYPQTLLVWESFGYPDFLLASADELVDAQYAGRPELRPILDAVLGAVSSLGQVDVQARKTYVALLTPLRTFAVVQATTKRRVDLGLRLSSTTAGGRLVSGKGVGNEVINLRIGLESVDDLDQEALDWLERAYRESS
ncbi:MAG TPA: DUF5655 domain-containing protein [Acidimicrobiales bacterium]|nr:DUF5655 domain-containing protein [Acidimicrobiales bacterium]